MPSSYVPTYPGAETYTIDASYVFSVLQEAAIDAGMIVQTWMYAPLVRFPDPLLDDHWIYLRLGHIMLFAFLLALIQYLNRVWGI